MAADFQSSFIPKGPVTQQVFKKKKTGFVGYLIILIFILSIVGAVGVYLYKGMVQTEVQNLEAQLAEAEKNIDKQTINEMVQFDKKLGLIQNIVSKHKIISSFLATLASSTVTTVQFTEFSYGSLKEGELSISLKGNTTDYASVALQESVFSQNKYFKSLTFSNLNLSTGGKVNFDVAIAVDPKIAVYVP
jgi:hypothetical protein